MSTLRYIIFRKYHNDNTDKLNLYVSEHGLHFSDTLSNYACSLITNANGAVHHWTIEQVKQNATASGFTLQKNCTWGDMTYLANMAYADFYPDVISEANCIKYAMKVVKDPDGYEGIAFNRWLADIKEKNITVDWEKYI